MSTPSPSFDFAVIGAGIAGASLAFQLARRARVIVLERESQPGYHSTGRSAAMFMESYGTPAIRALTRASRSFYEQPPEGFAAHPLLTPRGALYIASEAQSQELQAAFEALSRNAPNVRLVTGEEAVSMVPVLRADRVHAAIFEQDAQDIDVHALHQGYLKGMRARGGTLRCNAELAAAVRTEGFWQLSLADGEQVQARTLVNAAGAWADQIADLCKAARVGLEPRRRSAFTFAAPEGVDCAAWPVVAGIDESFYFKPDAGQLLGSPANADPVEPHDVVPEELDVALGIHHIENATNLSIRRPSHAWAGLRSFVPDGDFVLGWDEGCEGFFWLAGQGGYGIQTAAGASELAAALLHHEAPPAHLLAHGVDPLAFRPGRLR